ncbi:MAG: hypothetical protein U0Q12_15800 [Vicinamibacterales bacterium]
MSARLGRSRASVWSVGISLLALWGGTAHAQTGFVPYYGKNQVRYDHFEWKVYTTDHFEMYYYGDVEAHLERLAGYVESAYQHVSSELKHDISIKIPIVLFETHSEFEQQNIIPGAAPEGVAAFAEPLRDRMVLPIDEPPDQLYGLITHELTHIFEFDIIPRSLIRRGIPLWMDEGLSDYMRGSWVPLDLMTVRDAAVADIVPKMSDLEGYGGFSNPRLIYNLGHACFEFIESKYGKEGIRQFLFALRKSVIGGGENAYQEAFRVSADEFDDLFDKYLKDRFKPFRDKERPADYGRDLAPDPRKTHYRTPLSLEPSPSGDLVATALVNQRDGKLDVVLLSTKDGEIVRSLTPGFDQSRGYEYFVTPARFNTIQWMAWSPVGDRLAYFVRAEKQRTLILQNVVSKKIEERIEIKNLDAPESPDFSPDGRYVIFAGLKGAISDIYRLDLQTKEVVNLTNDEFADFGPTYSPDGKFILYLARVSGNDKLFRLDVDTKKKTQLTFGTHDDAGVEFLDNDTVIFPSTATDPNKPLDPEVARNAEIYNLWTLSLKTGELKQWTDSLTGVVSPVVLREKDGNRVAFITYFKGDYGLRTLSLKEPVTTATSTDFGEPGPIVDFQAPLAHTMVASNQRRKSKFEKLFLEGRPPVNVGVTSGGDVYGGSQLTFTDVLGDKQFNLFAASVQQYRTLSFSYVDLERRFQYALQAYSQTLFFYPQLAGLSYDPGLYFLQRSDAIATQTIRGGSLYGYYPLNRYRRLELFGGVLQYNESYEDPLLQQQSQAYQQQRFGAQIFRNGTQIPLGAALVSETTVFREFGPLNGSTMRLAYSFAPKVGNTLSNQTVDADARYYKRIGGTGVMAVRFRGYKSWGDFPNFFYYGGNSELRGYDYLQFTGQRGFFANAELRFPLIEAMLTPLGVMGGIRGVFFGGLGAAGFNSQPFAIYRRDSEQVSPIVDYSYNPATQSYDQVLGTPRTISGFRLVDGRASYGIGLQSFLLGFPIHFDWSWRTLFNKEYEDVLFSNDGGSSKFRRPRFAVWIGYDF